MKCRAFAHPVHLLAGLVTVLLAGLPARAAEAPAFACTFESPTWFADWGLNALPKNTSRVATSNGACLRVNILKDEHYGTSFKYRFEERTGAEPEELYAAFDAYYAFIEGYAGKSPGFDGTYGRAGWGGKPSDGRNGWSARSGLNGKTPGQARHSYYVYSGQQQGQYGDSWHWDTEGPNPPVPVGRWHRVEQYVKLNTPGQRDGVLRAWVNGRQVFERTDILFRFTDTLKVYSYWVDYYHGGKGVAPADFSLYLDNIVLAPSREIGRQAAANLPAPPPIP